MAYRTPEDKEYEDILDEIQNHVRSIIFSCNTSNIASILNSAKKISRLIAKIK